MRELLLDSLRTNLRISGLFCIIAFLVLGIIAITLSPIYSVAIVCTIIALYITVVNPEIGILILLFLLSSIVFEENLPLIPIGIGSLHLTDMLIIFMFCVLFYKLYIKSSIKLTKSPLNIPLLLFYSTAIISALIAVYRYNVTYDSVLKMLRLITYYLVFFLVTNLITEKKQIIAIVKGMFLLAIVVSMAMLIQAIVGDAYHLFPGRIENAGTFGQEYEALRLLPPGQTLLYTMFITATSVLVVNKGKSVLLSNSFYQIIVFGVGVILTYNRTYWVSIILVLAVLMVLVPNKNKINLLSTTIIISLSVCIIVTLADDKNIKVNEAFDSVAERFNSLLSGNELVESSSVDDRYTENEYAYKQIGDHPLMGIGLGNDYRPAIFNYDDKEDTLTYYIHNGYLWILVDMGLFGFLLFFWFYLYFLVRCFRNWKYIEDSYLKSIVVGFMLSGIGIIPMTFYNPIFMQWFSIVVIAIMVGLTESIINTSALAKFNKAN